MLAKLIVLCCVIGVTFGGIIMAKYYPNPNVSPWIPQCTGSDVYSYYYKRCISGRQHFMENDFDYNNY